jgi:hypothetical protein
MFYSVFYGQLLIFLTLLLVNIHSTMNTSNSHVDKYYVTKKSMVFLTLAPLNKSVKFGLKAKQIFLLFF